jgi:hypothetical protein
LKKSLIDACVVLTGALAGLHGGQAMAAESVKRIEKIEKFDARTWAQMQDQSRPGIVVFSATYCATCPMVLEDLLAQRSKSAKKIPIYVVMLDGSPKASPTKGPYGKADRFFVFDGNEQAIRYSVDPQWRGVTPYVALMVPGSKPVFVAGAPSDEQVKKLF